MRMETEGEKLKDDHETQKKKIKMLLSQQFSKIYFCEEQQNWQILYVNTQIIN